MTGYVIVELAEDATPSAFQPGFYVLTKGETINDLTCGNVGYYFRSPRQSGCEGWIADRERA